MIWESERWSRSGCPGFWHDDASRISTQADAIDLDPFANTRARVWGLCRCRYAVAMDDCYSKAAALLGIRAHFRAELEWKLRRRGFDDERIASVLERLVGEGLIDDATVARDFIAQRLARGPEGRRRLAAELHRRGVAGDVAAAALDDGLPEDDLEPARAAAARWSGRRRGDAAALARFLERKGFSSRAIVAVLRDLPEGGPIHDILD